MSFLFQCTSDPEREIMGLKVTITIDGAKRIEQGLWKATLKPEEAATLGECDSHSGPFSVLLLEASFDYDLQTQSLTFDPNASRLLNIGSTDQVILLSGESVRAVKKATAASVPARPVKSREPASKPPPAAAAPTAKKGSEIELSHALSTGDKLFLSELPTEMRSLGEQLLSGVRKEFHGELNYEPRAAKFDETPEIFWTVKIQPQDKTLRITVRGTPESFEPVSGMNLQLDKFGYSFFVLSELEQIPDALKLIRQGRINMM
jgi:hypothetical protein